MPGTSKTEGNFYLKSQDEKQCDPKHEGTVSTAATNDGAAHLVPDMVLFKDLLSAIRNSEDKETWELLGFIKAGACRSEIRQYMADRGLVQGDEIDGESIQNST